VKSGWMPAVLLVLVSAARGQTAPDLEIGRELFTAGKYQDALGFYKAVMTARPERIGAFVGMGRCLIALGRNQEALAVLRKVETLPKPKARVFSVMGQACYWEGLRRLRSPEPGDDRFTASSFFLDAAVNCSKAVRLDEGLHEAYYYLALAKLQSGAAGAAEKALRRANQVKPDQPTYLQNLGLALQLGGKYTEAAAMYERAVQVTPSTFRDFLRDTHARAGSCHGRAGNLSGAQEAFRKAVALDPLNAATFQMIWGMFGTEKKFLDTGIQVLRSLAGEDGASPLPFYYLGFFYKTAGKTAEARKAWEACLKIPGGERYPEAWALVAEYRYFQDKNEDEAVKCCRKALALDASNKKAYLLLQTLTSRCFTTRDWIRAETLTRLLLEVRPKEAREWSNLSLFLQKQRRYKEAWWALEKAMELAPEDAQILNSAGMILHYNSLGVVNPMEEARKLYERSLKANPDYLYAMENLGMILMESGEYERAVKLLRTVVERDPGRGVSMRSLNKALRKLKALKNGE